MKKILALLCIHLLSAVAFTEKADAICGLWFFLAEEGDSRTVAEIYEENGRYYGYTFAIKESFNSDFDINNPDPALQDKPLSNLIILYDLEFNKNSWREGHIYNPYNGKTYHAKLALDKSGNILEIKASIDNLGLFGKKLEWERVSETDALKDGDSLFIITDGPDRGQKMLRQGESVFLYFPDAEELIRLQGSELRDSVMGSDFSYDDVTGENIPLKERFNPDLFSRENLPW